VVPETWFFRDRGAFAALPGLLRADSDFAEELRILSFPCASGEEPYSIAIAMLEANFPRERFSIDAIDISSRLIRRATEAVYRDNSFRGSDIAFRDRYFAREADGFRLAEMIRSCVRFREGNLLHAGAILGADTYDVVFCRNLLIYFDAATQDDVLAALTRLVCPGGLLFVGPSETNLVLGRGFEPVKAPMAFAFRKACAQSLPAPVAARKVPPRAMARRAMHRPAASSVTAARPSGSAALAALPRHLDPGPAVDGLHEIERMADAGHLAEAARLCEALLRDARPSPEVLVLLALIRDAAGNARDAIELYRKALYLDPGNEAALGHLALRLEAAGDLVGADRLKRRLQRIGPRRAK
jgi:chemotaxis protein methyltransferase WspC